MGVSYPSLKFFMLFWLQYWRIESRTLYLLDGHSMPLLPLVEQWAEVETGLADNPGMAGVSQFHCSVVVIDQ